MRRTFIVAALVVLACAVIYVVAVQETLVEAVRFRLAGDAARALGRDVSVTRISGDPVRGVVLEGVRVSNPPTVPPGTFFEAPRVVVRYDPGLLLLDLLNGRGVTASITAVEVERPFLVLTRDPQGRWNYADLFAARQGAPPSRPTFTARVTVHEGSLVFSDALRMTGRSFGAHFDRVTGTLDFAQAPRLEIALDAVNTDGATPALLRVAGRAALGEGTFDFDLTTRGASAAYWGSYLLRLPWLAWRGGTFDGVMHLLAARWGGTIALDYRGRLTLRDGRALLLPQQTVLSDIDGPLAVDNIGVTSEGLTMAVAASPVWVKGKVSHIAGVSVDLVLRSPALDLSTLQALVFPRAGVRLTGRAGGDVRIVGPVSSLQVEGTIANASGSINRQGFADLAGDFRYYGGLLVFDTVAVSAGGGRVNGHLRLHVRERTFFALADARTVDTRVLPGLGITIDPSLRGAATGFVAAAGMPGAVVAQGRVRVGSGAALGVGFDSLETLLGYDHGRVEVDRLYARSGSSTVHAYGEIGRSGVLALRLVATDVNLRTVGERFGLRGWLAGRADVDAALAGTVRRPVLSGEVAARNGRLGPFPFDAARGDVRVSPSGLSTSKMTLRDGRGHYEAAGSVRLGGAGRLALTVRAEDVPARRLLEIADVPLDLSGTVRGTVRLSGRPANPQAQGSVELREGRVEGQRVDRAQVDFRWTGTHLLLDRAVASVNSSTMQVAGSVSRRGALVLSFAAQSFNLKDIAALRSDVLRVSGAADLSGTVTGTLAAPAVQAAVASSSLTLNGQRFDRATGAVQYRGRRLHLSPLVLQQGDGTFRLSGTLALRADPVLELRLNATQAQLATLLGMAGVRAPFTLTGRVDADVAVSGPFSNPSGSLNARLTDGKIGDHPVTEAAVNLTLAGQAVTLRSLTLRPAQGELVAAGRIDLRGESDVEFGGTGLSLDLLRPLFNIRRPLAGTMDFALQISGRVANPVVGLSASVTNGAVGSTPFDRFVLQAFYRDGLFQIEQGLLQQGRHKARLEGSVPFNPVSLRFDESRSMDLRLSLSDADLSLLGLLTDRVERAEGPLRGEVRFTGTVANPKMAGSLQASDGAIKFRGIEPVLTAVAGDLTFDEAEIRVGRLTARAGEGAVSVTGAASIRNFRPDALRLQISADAARLQYAPVFSGIVDGVVRIEGTAARPVVGGALTLSRGDLSVGSLEPAGARAPAGGLNPVLDVDLRAGDELWVNVGSLRLQVRGTVHAAGTWRDPRLSGEATAGRGTLTAFNNTFTLTEGRATFAEFRGVVPFVDASAETRIGTAIVFLQIVGTPDNLTLLLSSDPPMRREEIVALLARQAGIAQVLQGDLEGALRAEIGNVLFGPFGRAVARALGLEEFRIEYDFVRPLQLRIGKLVVSNLYVTLTSEFGATPRYVWALEYRITPATRLTFSIDSQSRVEFLYVITRRF